MVDRIGVWGASGSGKSSWVKAYLAKQSRVIVFDPLGEYRSQGFREIRHSSADSLDRVRLAMAANWRGFRLAYVPPAGREAAALDILSGILKRANRAYQETGTGLPITLVVEEMNVSFPVAGGAEKNPGFADLCSRGRHYGIVIVGVSQRIAEVSTRFRGNCSQTVVFRQKGPRDLAAAEAELGIPRKQIDQLGALEYIADTGNRQITTGKILFRGKKPYLA